jgi:hypothetical protein
MIKFGVAIASGYVKDAKIYLHGGDTVTLSPYMPVALNPGECLIYTDTRTDTEERFDNYEDYKLQPLFDVE